MIHSRTRRTRSPSFLDRSCRHKLTPGWVFRAFPSSKVRLSALGPTMFRALSSWLVKITRVATVRPFRAVACCSCHLVHGMLHAVGPLQQLSSCGAKCSSCQQRKKAKPSQVPVELLKHSGSYNIIPSRRAKNVGRLPPCIHFHCRVSHAMFMADPRGKKTGLCSAMLMLLMLSYLQRLEEWSQGLPSSLRHS